MREEEQWRDTLVVAVSELAERGYQGVEIRALVEYGIALAIADGVLERHDDGGGTPEEGDCPRHPGRAGR